MLWKPTPLPPAWGNAIWAHPSLRALPYTTDALNRYQIQASIHEDLVPAEPLIWGATRDELRALRRVECYQREDGRDICGFRVVLEGQVEGRVVGNARAVGEKGDEVDEKKVGVEWPVRDVVGLGVDGAGGEVVVAVEVMRDEAIKAVKVSCGLFAAVLLLAVLIASSSGRIGGGRSIGARGISTTAPSIPWLRLRARRLSALRWGLATREVFPGRTKDMYAAALLLRWSLGCWC